VFDDYMFGNLRVRTPERRVVRCHADRVYGVYPHVYTITPPGAFVRVVVGAGRPGGPVEYGLARADSDRLTAALLVGKGPPGMARAVIRKLARLAASTRFCECCGGPQIREGLPPAAERLLLKVIMGQGPPDTG
jgi:hypothetical protein